MKHLIACGISLILFSNLHAQTNLFKDSAFSHYKTNPFLFNHTYQLQQQNNPIIPKIYFNKELKSANPSVLLLPKPDLTFVRKYNHSDIYQSTPDNMFIVKSDSTLIFNMPVADRN